MIEILDISVSLRKKANYYFGLVFNCTICWFQFLEIMGLLI